MHEQELAIIAKLKSQGCAHVGTFAFGILMRAHSGWAFFLPRALDADSGYSSHQLSFIEAQLAFLGLELLPLDRWLH